MGLPPPDAGFQVDFLTRIQRILTEGAFVASYKYALLNALANLAVEKGNSTGDSLTLTTREISAEVARLYWRQALPYPARGRQIVLRQNTGKEAKILRLVADAHDKTRTAGLRRPTNDQWNRLVVHVDETVRKMPLGKLQTMGGDPVQFLYDFDDPGQRSITLKENVAYCLRVFHRLIVELVRSSWLAYVRKQNLEHLGEAQDLEAFLFGEERKAIHAVAKDLLELQHGACFYCGRRLAEAGDVDHFVPRARYAADFGHNLVVTHATCNRNKSDNLAAERHLDRWVTRNDDHKKDLLEILGRGQGDEDYRASRAIARWAYDQVARGNGRVWVSGNILEPLRGRWEALLSPSLG